MTIFAPYELEGENASWALDDLHVESEVESPIPPNSRAYAQIRKQLDSLGLDPQDLDREVHAAREAAVISALWTAAQVAATSLALGTYASNKARMWRDRNVKLPKGTRLTLTLTPASKGDRRERTQIVISDIHTKTPDEITNEIRQTLMAYARRPPEDSGP